MIYDIRLNRNKINENHRIVYMHNVKLYQLYAVHVLDKTEDNLERKLVMIV